MSEVTDARHRRVFLQYHSSLPCRRNHGSVVRNTEACAHTGLLIDIARLARLDRDLLDDLFHEVRHHDWPIAAKLDIRFPLHDLDSQITISGVMRMDYGSDAIFQLRNHVTAAVVSRRIG